MLNTIRASHIEDAPGIARVQVDSWRTTYKEIVPDKFLAEISYERREQSARQHLSNLNDTYTYVAEDEHGQIVGFISGGLNRDASEEYTGELYAIYILKEAQGQGIDKKLTHALVERLVQEHYYSMMVWVLADNLSRHFYEALGGQYVSTKQIEIGGAMLDEVSYGWHDIRVME